MVLENSCTNGINSKEKNCKLIIIDTDPGIDDAFAVMMALDAHKRGLVHILAITLVRGNCSIPDSEKNILRVLEVFELDEEIPVYSGGEHNFVVRQESDPFMGTDGFNDLTFPTNPDLRNIKRNEAAHQSILRFAHEYPGQITLVAIGPLTNIATCIAWDATFASKLKELLIMGGNSNAEGNVTTNAEFNFYFDPEAAYVVVNRANCRIRIMPWETTHEHKISWEWRLKDLGAIDTPQAQLMNKLEAPAASARVYGDQYHSSCDQICMAVAIDETCCLVSKREMATVELQGAKTRGMLVIDKRYWNERKGHMKNNVEMIESINIEKVKKIMKRTFGHKMPLS